MIRNLFFILRYAAASSRFLTGVGRHDLPQRVEKGLFGVVAGTPSAVLVDDIPLLVQLEQVGVLADRLADLVVVAVKIDADGGDVLGEPGVVALISDIPNQRLRGAVPCDGEEEGRLGGDGALHQVWQQGALRLVVIEVVQGEEDLLVPQERGGEHGLRIVHREGDHGVLTEL